MAALIAFAVGFAAEPVCDGADKPPASRLQVDLLSAGGLAEESLYHLDVARHSDMRVALQRFSQ